jgi:hypothetical protein
MPCLATQTRFDRACIRTAASRAADTAEHRSGVRVGCCQLACTPSSDYKVSAQYGSAAHAVMNRHLAI